MVCDTIAYAHSKGIVHRDLKGENVVLGEFGEVTVIDWGLAKSIPGRTGGVSPNREKDSNSPTLDGERLGTPAYMAPEQARGDLAAIDERTDVYGLAAILYEVLTGRAPFGGSTANEVMHRVETQPPVRPSALFPETPDELEAICLKGLAKRKEDRYPTATALRDAVRAWLSHQLHRRSEADRQAKFFSLSHDLFVAMDESGVITQVNPAYARYFGFDPTQTPGKRYTESMHPDDHQRAREMLQQVLSGGAMRDTVIRIRCPNGDYRAASWSATRVPGEPTIYAVGRPLDEESRLRREVEAQARFFALSPNLFVVSDERGLASQVNPAWTTHLGWAPDEVEGNTFHSFVHPEDVPAITRSGRQSLVRGPVAELPVRMRCKDGSTKRFAWTLTRIAGERINYAIGRLIED
jgi:serine/threonine-protein kinase